jgi:hypothetical protein
MARGGARPGAGRPRGSRGERGRLLEERVRAAVGDDWCPVTFLCQVAADRKRPIELRIDAAKASAPYLAPRLKAVEVTNLVDIDIRELTRKLAVAKDDIEKRGGIALITPDADQGATVLEIRTGVPRAPGDTYSDKGRGK